MTDNEIIKALECCDADEESICQQCPYRFFESVCTHLLAQDAIALIKSLQEDNAAKDETITNLIEQIKALKEDIAREIFAEIDMLFVTKLGKHCGYPIYAFNEVYYELLKKKYLGEKKNNK